MAEQETVGGKEESGGELRGKLLARLAMAGVLVAGLLGVLAFFDHLSNTTDESEEQVFSKPVPVPPRKEVSQPLKEAESLPEPPVAKPEAPAAVEPPPPPQVESQPVAEAAAKPEAATPRATQPPAAARPAAAVAKQPVPEGTSAPSNLLPAPAPAPAAPLRPVAEPVARPQAPAARPVETRPAPLPQPSAPRLFSGFILQAGVFSSIQRAEELHARLTLSGVPSSLETRVQVGPFRTRQEAEAAQAKLKEMGIEAILVPPRGKN